MPAPEDIIIAKMGEANVCSFKSCSLAKIAPALYEVLILSLAQREFFLFAVLRRNTCQKRLNAFPGDPRG